MNSNSSQIELKKKLKKYYQRKLKKIIGFFLVENRFLPFYLFININNKSFCLQQSLITLIRSKSIDESEFQSEILNKELRTGVTKRKLSTFKPRFLFRFIGQPFFSKLYLSHEAFKRAKKMECQNIYWCDGIRWFLMVLNIMRFLGLKVV